MNTLLRYFLILIIVTPLSVNSEFFGKAEKATIRSAGILSVYASECGDLTPMGNKMFVLIVADQEKKGREIWESPEFAKGVNLFRDSIQIEGLPNTCKYWKNTLKKVPLWNKAIK